MIESVRTGKNVKIRRAIIDKSVTISDGMNVDYGPKSDSKNFTIIKWDGGCSQGGVFK